MRVLAGRLGLALALTASALACGKRGEPAFEILFEGRAFAVRQIQIAPHLGAVEGGVKVPEVPLGQVAEFGGLIQCFSG